MRAHPGAPHGVSSISSQKAWRRRHPRGHRPAWPLMVANTWPAPVMPQRCEHTSRTSLAGVFSMRPGSLPAMPRPAACVGAVDVFAPTDRPRITTSHRSPWGHRPSRASDGPTRDRQERNLRQNRPRRPVQPQGRSSAWYRNLPSAHGRWRIPAKPPVGLLPPTVRTRPWIHGRARSRASRRGTSGSMIILPVVFHACQACAGPRSLAIARSGNGLGNSP